MEKQVKKGETMEKALIVNTQYVENYDFDGGNHWKFKGGKEYVISFGVTKEIYEEDAYGEGEHSYYECPEVSEATIIALINQLGNASSDGYQEFVKSWETTDFPKALTENELEWHHDKEAFDLFKATRMNWKDLEKQVKDGYFGG
tara:strand:+ start:1477 stop:1911 length:435 start_codon:yes stop_codon:yes gene_type:complete